MGFRGLMSFYSFNEVPEKSVLGRFKGFQEVSSASGALMAVFGYLRRLPVPFQVRFSASMDFKVVSGAHKEL